MSDKIQYFMDVLLPDGTKKRISVNSTEDDGEKFDIDDANIADWMMEANFSKHCAANNLRQLTPLEKKYL